MGNGRWGDELRLRGETVADAAGEVIDLYLSCRLSKGNVFVENLPALPRF